jgi:hypothetical protein
VLLLLAASAWLYGALLVLYPEAFRRRYSEEMRRDFRELMREGLEDGGAKELVRVLAQAYSDLVLTALKERSTKFLRNAYLPVAPETAARWGALSALLGGLLGATTFVPYLTRGNVEATETLTGQVASSGSPEALALAMLLSVLGIFGLYGTLVVRSGRPAALALSGATLAALSAVCISALLYGDEIAGSLGWLWPPGEGFSWWEIHWKGFLQEIGMGAYALGLVLLGASAFRARLFGRLRALPLVVAPLRPASIGLLILLNRSGMEYLAELIIGAMPFFRAALLGWVMLNYHPTERPEADD